MAKAARQFTCTACGAVHRKWAGRCDACGAWNSIVEEAPPVGRARNRWAAKGRTIRPHRLSRPKKRPRPAPRSGIDELDRVLGGGLVPASAILVGGDPGIGKSTLLLQAAASFARAGLQVPLHLRRGSGGAGPDARRNASASPTRPCTLAAETNLRDILTTLEAETPGAGGDRLDPDHVARHTSKARPAPSAQVRAAAHELVTFAKRRGVAVILVGHVTKDGQIAGPRVVEHMVDTVLYFEGERGHQFRILRAVKNRFGPADEIGVFEMTGAGLAEVANPSALFLSDRDTPRRRIGRLRRDRGHAPGPGRDPGPRRARRRSARRAARWWAGTAGRLSMILAVLEARCGIPFAGLDVYLNVAGGLRISEPAADLAVAAALLSAREDVAIAARDGAFRRDQPVRRAAPGRADRKPVERSLETWFLHRRRCQPGRKSTAAAGLTVRRMPDLTAFVGDMFGAG